MTPMESVLSKLNSVGIDLGKLKVLEMFGFDGSMHTKDYGDKVGSLDIWEIDTQYESALTAKFPQANVKICDSFQEVKATSCKYDMIIIDNPMGIYCDDKYCEHFELFPDIFKITNDICILLLNVIPNITEEWHNKYRHAFTPEHWQRRSQFYQCANSENISIEYMAYIYSIWMRQAGFDIRYLLFEQRSCVYYLGFIIKRR